MVKLIYLDCESSSLKGDIGILIAVGMILPNGEFKVFFAESPEDEKEVIKQTMETLRKFKGEPIYIWHSGFDIPFIITRAIKNNIDVSDLYDFKFVDLCRFAKENLKLASNKLDEVSKFLGISKDLKTTGKNVQELYLKAINGDREAANKIIEHCKDDVEALKAVHQRLKPYVDRWELNNVKF